MTVRRHVDQFLFPLNPRGSLSAVGGALVEAANYDEESANRLRALHDSLEQLTIPDADVLRYLRIRGSAPLVSIAGLPEEVAALLATGYLRAQHDLPASPPLTRVTADLREPLRPGPGGYHPDPGDLHSVVEVRRRLAAAREGVDRLEPEFLGELLVEVGTRANRDPLFAAQLQEAAANVHDLGERLNTSTGVMAAAAARSGTFHCTISGNNVGSWVCGAVIVIVVVIIIVK